MTKKIKLNIPCYPEYHVSFYQRKHFVEGFAPIEAMLLVVFVLDIVNIS